MQQLIQAPFCIKLGKKMLTARYIFNINIESFHGRSPNGCQVKNFIFQISSMVLIH